MVHIRADSLRMRADSLRCPENQFSIRADSCQEEPTPSVGQKECFEDSDRRADSHSGRADSLRKTEAYVASSDRADSHRGRADSLRKTEDKNSEEPTLSGQEPTLFVRQAKFEIATIKQADSHKVEPTHACE